MVKTKILMREISVIIIIIVVVIIILNYQKFGSFGPVEQKIKLPSPKAFYRFTKDLFSSSFF